MKTIGRVIRSCICAFGLGLLLSSSGLYALVTWFPGNTPDVTNDILDIVGGGPIALVAQDPCNAVSINAFGGGDVIVNITGTGNAVVTGNATGQTILRLNTSAGSNITFNLPFPNSLTFEGSTDVALSPLLILVEGNGNVVFKISGGSSLTLTSDGTHGGTQMYLLLSPTGTPTLQFLRVDSVTPDQLLEAYLTVGASSILSYASTDGLINLSTGQMIFNPTNVQTGRFVLQVEDTGAFIMAVSQAVFDPDAGDICSVNVNIPAGGTPVTLIVNSGGANADAALMINNYNATYSEYLIDPFGDLGAASDPINYSGSFTGRFGVVAGANHALVIEDNAYLDYVGLSNNICPTPGSLPGIVNPAPPLDCPCDPGIQQFLKLRNYSAFVIDGWYNPNSLSSVIDLGDQSGIYFRSGVDVDGDVNSDFSDNPFTINPALMTPGAGEYVFDVEAKLQVLGDNLGTTTLNSRIETLSLLVIPLDGPLFPVEGVGNPPIFLARTFATSGGQLLQYNKAAWLINDRAEFSDTAIAHTDTLHMVCQNNDVISEPTYVGGEKWWLSQLRGLSYPFNYCISVSCPPVARPSIDFYDSLLQVQYSMGATGVDFQVPTLLELATTIVVPNTSEFRFYSNGYLVDNGTGRQMILGTLIGSQACDGCTIISDDAHLNIIQDLDFTTFVTSPTQTLNLTVSDNNSAVNDNIIGSVAGQTSIEVIYLGHNSNISIGNQPLDDDNPCITGFTNETCDSLFIAGDFFNIGTRGGALGIPSTSDVTGQGGIFVDLNGFFGILPDYIASLDVMVTVDQNCAVAASCTGVVSNGTTNLPPSQIFFASEVGLAAWQKNLVTNPVIVPTGSTYDQYTLDWLSLTKSPSFFPYLISDINVCSCPPFNTINLTDIPVVQGEVNQLQIAGSRIGDPAHILISGGWVREILWLNECKAGEAPTAVIVLNGNGRLGLNNAHRNPDSTLTQTVLGANGINLVADGNCRIDINTDVIINNICSIIQGPDFAPGDVVEFLADTPYTIHVTSTGILDLSNFTVAGTIRFGGNIRMNFEPGARLILGASTVEFSDNAMVEVESAYELQLRISALDSFFGAIDNTVNPLVSVLYTLPNNQYSPLTGYGTGVQNTDPYRVRMMGEGTITFTDNSMLLINTNGVLGIESLNETLPNGTVCTIPTTSVVFNILESARVNIGQGNTIWGGVFQVGDTVATLGNTVNFMLTINGPDAQFNISAGGFFGLGAGVARPNQGSSDSQSNVLADTLADVGQITLNLFGGEFDHNRIFISDDARSSSMVLGLAEDIAINYITIDDLEELNAADYVTSGGGNFFLLRPGSLGTTNLGALRLINRTDDGTINAPFGSITVPLTRLFASLLGSTELLSEATNLSDTPVNIFSDIKTGDSTNAFGPATGLADCAALDPDRFRQERTFGLLGYVDRSMIGRQEFQNVIDSEGGTAGERRSRLYDLGAARVQIDTTVPAPGPVLAVRQIRSE